MSNKRKQIEIYIVACIILIILTVIGCKFGGTEVSLIDTLNIILGKVGIVKLSPNLSSEAVIVWNLRLPRLILAAVVGGGLAICGVAMQALTQNVLAEPYILGIASGASFGIVLATLIFFSNVVVLAILIPGFAFMGAILATFLVYQVGGGGSNSKLILAGMALSIIFNALANLLIHFLPHESALKNVTMWMWGSLAGARWHNIGIPIIVSICSLIIFSYLGRNFNIISLGNETATNLGIDVKKMRRNTMIMISILTGVLISVSGLIGFIGFIVPHAVRILRGADHKFLFKNAFLAGSIFLICMDILARTILAPREIAVGVFSALCGGPFFIWLLYRKNKGLES